MFTLGPVKDVIFDYVGWARVLKNHEMGRIEFTKSCIDQLNFYTIIISGCPVNIGR